MPESTPVDKFRQGFHNPQKLLTGWTHNPNLWTKMLPSGAGLWIKYEKALRQAVFFDIIFVFSL
ncbi:hypothetical protein CVD19_18120 [Bacillus sp. T33-2]|nr:hypothetical protein CVD19_18120 [Bacillus sp. T33-2]